VVSTTERLLLICLRRGLINGQQDTWPSRYGRERLTNNIDLLEHVLKTSPQTVSRNPAGWLRRAIEQDFAGNGEHHGFQTRQQKAAKATAQKQRLAAQQQALDAREREQRAMLQRQDLARRKQLETLREQYCSTAREREDMGQCAEWTQVNDIGNPVQPVPVADPLAVFTGRAGGGSRAQRLHPKLCG
jgi:hypothetical protein